MGGGAEWVELFITLTKGMGEPTYGLLLSLIASRSASDNIRTIIEKTESVYVQKFQRLINGTLFSGEFQSLLPANEKL